MLHSLSLKSIHTFYTYAKYIPNIKIQITALVIVPIYVYFKNLFSSLKLLIPITNHAIADTITNNIKRPT